MNHRKAKSGYLSAGATTFLLVIAISAIVYATVKVTKWYEKPPIKYDF